MNAYFCYKFAYTPLISILRTIQAIFIINIAVLSVSEVEYKQIKGGYLLRYRSEYPQQHVISFPSVRTRCTINYKRRLLITGNAVIYLPRRNEPLCKRKFDHDRKLYISACRRLISSSSNVNAASNWCSHGTLTAA